MSSPGLPSPHDLLDTADVGALLFASRKHPATCAWHWITVNQIPTYRVGRSLRVLGASVLEAMKRKPSRLKAVAS